MTSPLAAYVEQVVEANVEACARAAQAVVSAGQADALVYVAGAGHSLAAVMETFYRPGGLACVRPLWDPTVLILAGARASSQAERTPGSGRAIVDAAGLTSHDAVVVFSTSGVNPYPVEIAQGARERGATVIAVTACAASRVAPARAGTRLYDVADVVLDTLAQPGDVSWPVGEPQTVALSTLGNVVLWSEVLRRVVEQWPDAPLWRSSNVAGNDGGIEATAARFASRIPEL